MQRKKHFAVCWQKLIIVARPAALETINLDHLKRDKKDHGALIKSTVFSDGIQILGDRLIGITHGLMIPYAWEHQKPNSILQGNWVFEFKVVAHCIEDKSWPLQYYVHWMVYDQSYYLS